MVAPLLEAPGSRLVMPAFHSSFLTSIFLKIFPSMSFSLSNVAVLVSVRHLEVGVKEKLPWPGIEPPGYQSETLPTAPTSHTRGNTCVY